MQKMTSAYANKKLKSLEEDKAFWVNKEATSCTYLAAINEEPVIPEYVRYMDPRLFREGPMGLTPEQMEMLDPEYEFWRDLRPGGEGGESRG